jgi:hypothetical protein
MNPTIMILAMTPKVVSTGRAATANYSQEEMGQLSPSLIPGQKSQNTPTIFHGRDVSQNQPPIVLISQCRSLVLKHLVSMSIHLPVKRFTRSSMDIAGQTQAMTKALSCEPTHFSGSFNQSCN